MSEPAHGYLVTFEGSEGAGKTTQAQRLANRIADKGWDVVLTREPGGTELGDRIRELVLVERSEPISPRAETHLYCAARAQLVEERLRPELDAGRTVIVDRYGDSTLAYQAYGRGLNLNAVQQLLRFATDELVPDLTFLLDLPVDVGLRRKRAGWDTHPTDDWNRFESESFEFHQRVRDGYHKLAKMDPNRWRVIDAQQPIEVIAGLVWQEFKRLAAVGGVATRSYPSDSYHAL